MTKIILRMLLLLVPALLTAQKEKITFVGDLFGSNSVIEITTENNWDTTRVTYFKKQWDVVINQGTAEIKMVHSHIDKFRGNWGGIGIGLNNFFSTPFNSELPPDAEYLNLIAGKSVEVALNLFRQNIRLQQHRNNIGLVTGVGLTLSNYRFNQYETRLGRDAAGQTCEIPLAEDRIAMKNKLLVRTITVPLLFEYQSPNKYKSSLYINAGIYGGLNFSSHIKVKYSDKNGVKKEKFREDFNINPFKYGAMVRTGNKWINLYASYDMSMLFKKGRGAPEIYPWSVGIMLASF